MNCIPFCLRVNSVLRPLSDRDWAQGKADVTKVGHGYSFTTRTFPHWDHSLKHWTRSENKDSYFCSKYLSGGTILVNCLENERTVSMMKGEEENLRAHKP
jgi:hypothetical protein